MAALTPQMAGWVHGILTPTSTPSTPQMGGWAKLSSLQSETDAPLSPDVGTGSGRDADASSASSSASAPPKTQPAAEEKHPPQSVVHEKEQKLRGLEERKREMTEKRRAFVIAMRIKVRETENNNFKVFKNCYGVPADWWIRLYDFLASKTDEDPGSILNDEFFDDIGILRDPSVIAQEFGGPPVWLSGGDWWIFREVFGHGCAVVRDTDMFLHARPVAEEVCGKLLAEIGREKDICVDSWDRLEWELDEARDELAMELRKKIKEEEKPIAELRARLKEVVGAGDGGDLASVVGDVDLSCAVCMTTRRTILFKPCRHCCTCEECAERLWRCPVCNAHIDEWDHVYL